MTEAGKSLWVTSMYGHKNREALVVLTMPGGETLQMTPEEARHHAQVVIECAEAAEQDFEAYRLEDADIGLVAYGIISRIAQGAVDAARAQGLKVGLLRPKTLYPFPVDAVRAFVARGGDVQTNGTEHYGVICRTVPVGAAGAACEAAVAMGTGHGF